jgi:SAM-dependent methyltransferase
MQSAQYRLHAEVEDEHWWFVGRRRIMLELVREALGAGPALVVDVGCGTGANVAAVAQEFACVGVDPSDEAVELARRRFPDLRFLCGEAPDDLSSDLGGARMVLLMDVLEHVADDFAFFSRLLAATAPGTQLLVTVPAVPSAWSPHDESNGHYRRYDMDRLQRVWAGLPVSVRMLSHYNARLFPVAAVVRTLGGWCRRSVGRAGTDVGLPPRQVNAALAAVFAGESRVLVDLLRGCRQQGYRSGLSLVAVLRREAGEVPSRSKPADIGPDRFDPSAGRALAG